MARKYFIEVGHHINGRLVVDFTLERDDFNDAKNMIKNISTELKNDIEYHISKNTYTKMYDNDTGSCIICYSYGKTGNHTYHYITVHYPNISLPSQERN